jgi:hypothetical protein
MPNSQNRISATFTKAEQEKLLKGLESLQKLLPFLVSLSSDERADLFKVGDKSQAFIRKASEAAQAHPEALPRNFDEKEFKKDADLVETLYPVVMALRQLTNSVEDTFALAGSEAYAGALVVYRALRDNDIDGQFESAVDDLSTRFARKSGKKSPDKPA